MPSDSRWTGGAANRGWQSGTRLEPPVDTEAITGQVREYLRDCKRFQHLIGPAHPTEEGVLKIVFHTGNAQKQAVLTVFRQRTAARRPAANQEEAATAASREGEPGDARA